MPAEPAVPTAPPAARPGDVPRAIPLRELALLALTAIALYLCFLMARPFVASLAWSVALAVIGWPLQRRLAVRLRSRTAAACGTVALILLAVVLPASVLAPRVAAEAVAGLRLVESQLAAGTWDDVLERYASIGPWLEWVKQRVDLADLVRHAGTTLTLAGSFAVRASLVGVVEFVLVFFFLFYMLRDRDTLLGDLAALLPLSGPEWARLVRVAADTVLATVFGKVVVGIVQGVLGGAMFWLLGLPAAGFWGIAMAVLSIVPLLGPPLVWAPAALLLVLDGQWLAGAVLAAWGAAVVGLADNLLYPMVVGRFLHLHTVPLLIAMIGGIVVFGAAGFFVGPVVLALTVAMLAIWRERDLSRGRST